MHAFDLSCVQDSHIIVAEGKEGEKTVTLDGKERVLPDNTLVIADPKGAVGIAGIMGGENSEITENTKVVLFGVGQIQRRQHQALCQGDGHDDRGIPALCQGDWTSRAPSAPWSGLCQLVEELGAGKVEKGVIDVCKGDISRRHIVARPEKINSLVAWTSGGADGPKF